MLTFTTGNIFDSEAEALVNTVNCEGYMGKGIAYQFKRRYPLNNKHYVADCRSGRLRPGSLSCCHEDGKFIINFPTKDRWRAVSKFEYIEDGLDALCELIKTEQLKSIAIPPLGSGNGGLDWHKVRTIIECKLAEVSSTVDITVYCPYREFDAQATYEPMLHTSALVLMSVSENLDFNGKFRLQKACFFTDIQLPKPYFRFKEYKFGPYDHVIDILSKEIRAFKDFHHIKSTIDARDLLYRKLMSRSVDQTLKAILPKAVAACRYVNSIESDHELECLSTICYILSERERSMRDGVADVAAIVCGFADWPEDKAARFTVDEIHAGVERLIADDWLIESREGFLINRAYADDMTQLSIDLV